MRILVVAMSDSIHTARWLSQISDQGWDVHLFPSFDCGVTHPDLRNLTVHHWIHGPEGRGHPSVKTRSFGIPSFKTLPLSKYVAPSLIRAAAKLRPERHSIRLAKLIRKLKPDVIHTLEMQGAGYLTMSAKKRLNGKFPPWVVTPWGSDIYLFGRLRDHADRVREVLENCDYYSCDSRRDLALAKKFGFKKEVLPLLPNVAGGYDLEHVRSFRQPGPTSKRRLIVLKGYQNWAGRALVGLRALERCADQLKGYEIAIYAASPETELAAELFQIATGIPVTVVPKNSPRHETILSLHGRARISIGLSISDGISSSFLEAITMGSFPIQSWTSTANEWITDGIGGLLVPPDDVDVVESAIRKALASDTLVDEAVRSNDEIVTKRLDGPVVKELALQIYSRAAAGRQSR